MYDGSEIENRRKKLVAAGYKAVDELIKVLEAPILKKKSIDSDDDLAAEKMKTAAQAKKIALEDALDILSRVQKEEEELDKRSMSNGNEEDNSGSFAERRANRS